MNKKTFFTLMTSLALPLLSAQRGFCVTERASGVELVKQYASTQEAVAQPVLSPAAGPETSEMPDQPARDWTFMVFLNGRSNVEAFAVEDMNELEQAGSSSRVNVVAELGRMSGTEGPDSHWTGSRRYYVVKDDDTSVIKSPVLSSKANPDMGDYREVVSFVKWAKKKFPARRYALVIWDHGWGWMDPSQPMSRSISHDFASGNAIKTTQLKTMFQQFGGVDMYASMACFMQMMETSYEIKDYAGVIVGSEEVIQLPSFDFDAFLNLLSANPSADAEAAGKYLVGTFKDLYSQPGTVAPGYGVQLSAIRADKLSGVKAALDSWVALAQEAGDAQALKAAMKGVIRFEVGDENTDPAKTKSPYADLGDFIRLYNSSLSVTGPKADAVRAAGLALLKAMKDMTVAHTGFGKDRVGNDFSQTSGMALDIPGLQDGQPLLDHDDTYGKLDFVKDGLWNGFHKQLEELNKPDKK